MSRITKTESFALFTARLDEENQPELIFPVTAKDNSYSFVACDDCVIKKQEVANGVYVAETIVRPCNGKTPTTCKL
jgi:hypothetical protein